MGCVQNFPNKEKMKMNVYDFDNTIYDGESFIDLFIFLFKKDPSLVKYIPDVINGLYKYTKGTINAEEALEQYSDVVTEYYKGIEDFDALVTEFWDTNIHKIKPFYFRQRQDDDVIISASPEILLDEGYIKSYDIREDGVAKYIHIDLKYGPNKSQVITGLRRVSKPGLRIYTNCEDMPRVMKGLGIAILSTSKGIMTDKDARKANVGGEVLAFIW